MRLQTIWNASHHMHAGKTEYGWTTSLHGHAAMLLHCFLALMIWAVAIKSELDLRYSACMHGFLPVHMAGIHMSKVQFVRCTHIPPPFVRCQYARQQLWHQLGLWCAANSLPTVEEHMQQLTGFTSATTFTCLLALLSGMAACCAYVELHAHLWLAWLYI